MRHDFGCAAAKPKFLLTTIFTEETMISPGTQRTVFRWIHLILSIPILGYIYSPFDKLPDYAPKTRYVFVPLMILSGLWMWKGHVVRRLFSRRPAQLEAAGNR